MRRGLAIAAVAGAAAVLGGFLWFRGPADGTGAAGGERGAGGGRGGFGGPVPVAVAPVSRRDVPIYLDGLGTVQAFNTVTVRPQVSGQLLSVEFEEGEEVQAGDLLAVIDARTFESQLNQAQGQKAQNEALLNTAKRDLQRFSELVGDGYVSKQQLDTQAQTVAQLEATVKGNEAAVQNARVSLGFARVRAPISGITGLRLVDAGNVVDANTTGGLVVVTQIRPISVIFTLPEQSLGDIRGAGGQGLSVVALDRDNAKQLATGALTVVDNQIDQTTGTIRLKATFANDDKALWPGQFVNVRLLVRTEQNGLVIPASAVQRGPEGDFVYVAKAAVAGPAGAGESKPGERAESGKAKPEARGEPRSETKANNKPEASAGGPPSQTPTQTRTETPTETAEKRDVKVARSENGIALIESGLNDGDRIVIDGQYRLQPGSKIRIAAPDVGPDAAPATAAASGGGAPAKPVPQATADKAP